MAIEKIEILGAILEPIWPIWPNFEINGLDWQCCLAGSSKTAPRIFILSIVLGDKYEIFEYIISVLASVNWSEFHLSEMTCYKIHTLVADLVLD